jgi:hypothetical protein
MHVEYKDASKKKEYKDAISGSPTTYLPVSQTHG